MAIAVGQLRMSLSDFYDLTPMEFKRIHDRFIQDRMRFFELQQIANYVGFGQALGGKKFKSVFSHKQTAKVKRVTAEQKQKDLQDILNRLEGKDGDS